MSQIFNLEGKQFFFWTVIAYHHTTNHKIYWHCKCKCGITRAVLAGNLLLGKSKSCGCYKSIRNKSNARYHWKTRLYRIWKEMRTRTTNPNRPSYKYYGAKGIKVCKRWQNFQQFQSDMSQSYQEHCKAYGEANTTIDRLNNNKGYNPSNCRWATRTEQSRNREYVKNKILSF